MRKVLLASTALFALGSVSAMAADITISGSTEFVADMGDSATADDSGFAIEHDIAITFSNTTDSGITMSMTYGIDDDGTPDDSETTISGDFGELRYTQAGDEHALNDVDIEAGATAEEVFSRTTAGGGLHEIQGIGDNHVTYVLPSIIDGLYVAGSAANASAGDEVSSYAVRYSASGLTAVYGQVKGHVVTTTHVGVAASFGDIGIQLAQNTDDTAGLDNKGVLMGLTYTMGDITLGYESEAIEDGVTAGNDEKHTAVGATYAIAPGLSASLTMAESDRQTGLVDTATTSVGLHVSF
jgi:predicted porin